MLEYAIPVGMFIVFIILFYGIIVVHDIPYEIAVHRNHPHQDAIHVAGWISLFTIGAIWPFLWIWATLYREDRGWGMISTGASPVDDSPLLEQFATLEERLDQLENPAEPPIAEPADDSPLLERLAVLEERLDQLERSAEPPVAESGTTANADGETE